MELENLRRALVKSKAGLTGEELIKSFQLPLQQSSWLQLEILRRQDNKIKKSYRRREGRIETIYFYEKETKRLKTTIQSSSFTRF
ncbi:hypothetical protein ACOMX4_002545 [Enterococcus faecalis]